MSDQNDALRSRIKAASDGQTTRMGKELDVYEIPKFKLTVTELRKACAGKGNPKALQLLKNVSDWPDGSNADVIVDRPDLEAAMDDKDVETYCVDGINSRTGQACKVFRKRLVPLGEGDLSRGATPPTLPTTEQDVEIQTDGNEENENGDDTEVF